MSSLLSEASEGIGLTIMLVIFSFIVTLWAHHVAAAMQNPHDIAAPTLSILVILLGYLSKIMWCSALISFIVYLYKRKKYDY